MLDAVIVLGQAWERPLNRKDPQLSIEACMVVLAAVQLYLGGKTKYIIITGGKTAGKNNKSESEKMFEYIYTIFTPQEIPTNIFKLEKEALDTGENARNIREILKKNNFKKLGLVTTSWHMKRALRIFEASDINISDKFISDEIIEKIDTSKITPLIIQLQEFAKLKTQDIHVLLQAFLKSTYVNKFRLKEKISTFISLVDKEEKFLHLITKNRIKD